MKIIQYNSCRNILVEFQDKYKYQIYTSYNQFKIGAVKNPYDKSLYNVGYFGEGNYKARINKKVTPQYLTWSNMLRRCYNKKYHDWKPTYIDCKVCDKWHNYQVFAEWYNENYYKIGEEIICLDKDILHKHNKLYSPENCIFVPQKINTLFIKKDANRGGLPIGVQTNHSNKKIKYSASCSNCNGNIIHLGNFNTQIEALNAYKEYKKFIIVKIVTEYKNLIPKNTYNKLYNAVLKYEVEDDD